MGREKEAHVAGGDCMRRPVLQDVRLKRWAQGRSVKVIVKSWDVNLSRAGETVGNLSM